MDWWWRASACNCRRPNVKTMSDTEKEWNMKNHRIGALFSTKKQSGLKVTSELLKSDKQTEYTRTHSHKHFATISSIAALMLLPMLFLCVVFRMLFVFECMEISHFADGLGSALIQPQSSSNGWLLDLDKSVARESHTKPRHLDSIISFQTNEWR